MILFPRIWDLGYRYKSSLKTIRLSKSSVFVRDPTLGSVILLVPKSWIRDLLTCSIFPSPKSTYSYIRVLVIINFNSLFLRKKEFIKFDIYSLFEDRSRPIEGNTPPTMVSAPLIDTRSRTRRRVYCVLR